LLRTNPKELVKKAEKVILIAEHEKVTKSKKKVPRMKGKKVIPGQYCLTDGRRQSSSRKSIKNKFGNHEINTF
jgi:hypothetical protein